MFIFDNGLKTVYINSITGEKNEFNLNRFTSNLCTDRDFYNRNYQDDNSINENL